MADDYHEVALHPQQTCTLLTILFHYGKTEATVTRRQLRIGKALRFSNVIHNKKVDIDFYVSPINSGGKCFLWVINTHYRPLVK